MILPGTIIKLDYNPATDVLFVEWPDVLDSSKSEAVYALEAVVEAARLYDVKYLLVDTRHGVVGIKDSEYIEMLTTFAHDLMTTRLKKLARVINMNTYRGGHINEVMQKTQLEIPIESFENEDEALVWLESADIM